MLIARSITTSHPDLDCVFINSGIQRGLDFSKPESVNLNTIQTEFTTNYLAYLALTKAFLPFLQSKNTESGLILYEPNAAPLRGQHGLT